MTDEASTSKSSIPPEVVKKLGEFNTALTAVEEALEKHFAVKFDEHLERPCLEMARIDVMSLFTLSSLGWCLSSMKGEEPNENPELRSELNRTKEYHGRLKTIDARKQAPRVNAVASKNFVRNALWEVPPSATEPMENEAKQEEDSSAAAPKKKKKRIGGK